MLAEVRAHDATAADRFKKRIDKIEASLQPYKRPSYCMATSQVEVRQKLASVNPLEP